MNFPYKWTLEDTVFTKDKGTVFSCFACGGGSTMGYKLAGFDVIGCNEIDAKMMNCYKTNHNPQFSYLEPIQTFKTRPELPEQLYQLDILDGSPPCSSFSIAGNREKDWGKKKKFREGQAKQTLDTLFFDFIDLAKLLQPKVVLAENVKGILLGNAKRYCAAIYQAFDAAGYYLDKWLLDSSKMGVPQRRERVFFIGIRKDLAEKLPKGMDMFNSLPELNLEFNEPGITFGEIMNNCEDDSRKITTHYYDLWSKCPKGKSMAEVNNGNGFNNLKLDENKVCPTIGAANSIMMPNKPHYLGNNHFSLCGTYPLDYEYNGKKQYIVGMSVPPVMVAQIATRIYKQWLSKL